MTDRQLIRNIRVEAVGMACRCDEWYSRVGKLCDRCELLRVIDNGLAEIGASNNDPVASLNLYGDHSHLTDSEKRAGADGK